MAFTHARLRRPAGDGAVALHCAEAPPLAPPEKHPSSLASSQLAAHEQPSLPQRPAGLSCLTSRGRQAAAFSPPRWLPHGRRQSEQRRARAYCPVHPPPAAPEFNHFVLAQLFRPITYFDAPTTRANWTETFLPALKRPLPTSRGGWRGLRRLWWWTGCLDSSYDYGHRGQREPRVRTRPRLMIWGVNRGRFCQCQEDD